MKKIFVPLALVAALVLSAASLVPPNPSNQSARLRGWQPIDCSEVPLFNQFAEQPAVVDALTAYYRLESELNLSVEPFKYNGPEDSVYIAPTQEDIDDMVASIRKRREGIPYTGQAFDCDDFATEAKYWATVWSYRRFSGTRAALLFGKAYVKLDGNYDLLFPGFGHATGYHVLNFFVRNDGQVFYYEPQSGKVAPVESFIYEGSIEVLKLEF